MTVDSKRRFFLTAISIMIMARMTYSVSFKSRSRTFSGNREPSQVTNHGGDGGGMGGIPKSLLAPVIGAMLPEELAPYSSNILDIVEKGDSEACGNLAVECLNPRGPVGCKEALTNCISSSFVGPAPEKQFSEIGDIDLPFVIQQLATVGQFTSVKQLIRSIVQTCQAYFPESLSNVLRSLNPLKAKPTPQHPYVCNALTGHPVTLVGAGPPLGLSSSCAFDQEEARCQDNVQRATTQLNNYFGVYLAMINGDSNALSQYYPGASLQAILQRDQVAVSPSLSLASSFRTTVTECMRDADHRVQCVAAGLLAEACESGCATARCSWKTLYSRGGCSFADKTAIFSQATALCQDMARELKLSNPPLQCVESFSSRFVMSSLLLLCTILLHLLPLV